MQKEDMNSTETTLPDLQRTIARWTGSSEEYITAVPGLSFYRYDAPTEKQFVMYEPCICMVAQGAKRVTLGNETYGYDTRNYLITSVHLPGIVQVIKASREKPYLGLVLILNQREISRMMVDSNLPVPREQQAKRGMATSEVTLPLLSAFQRLVELLDEPTDIPILAPIIQREIIYRLLVGEQGARLRQIASAGSQSQQIAKAINWIKEHFNKPLRIEDLAEQARMSTSTFHHHFRSMTNLSPLQFQKQVRL